MKTYTITDINGFGDGVTRLDNKAVFVPKTLPQDQVSLDNIQDFKRYSKALHREIVTKSPHREAPLCEHFDLCGGCQIQGANKSSYPHIKLQIFKNLSRHTLKDSVQEIVLGDKTTNFRNKAVFNFSKQNSQLFYNDILGEQLTIQSCPILEDSLQKILSTLQEVLPNYPRFIEQNLKKVLLKSLPNQKPILGFDIKQHSDNQSLLEEFSLDLQEEVSGIFYFHSPSSHFAVTKPKWIINPKDAYEEINDLKVPYSPEMFFQSNREIMSKIYSTISQWVKAGQFKNVLDLYTGVGGTLFSMNRDINFGLGLEVNPQSIQVANSLKSKGKFTKLKFQTTNLPRGLKNALRDQPSFDLCMVNPPRKGLGQKMIQTTASLLPNDLIYLSCNPQTLESDLKQFYKEGYQLKSCKVFDMFPWTNHFETLVHISKV
ncbi:MAG: 23S rRNA (uracil(1939)-C(5))-methyltransferase RlmD [Candidatus Cloacimonetes bacterium]|nr:23S rRNA (uracil(1939)-C(5))-methyltransferase RlmD [Candidatus Cloacimonadota bacterium]